MTAGSMATHPMPMPILMPMPMPMLILILIPMPMPILMPMLILILMPILMACQPGGGAGRTWKILRARGVAAFAQPWYRSPSCQSGRLNAPASGGLHTSGQTRTPLH